MGKKVLIFSTKHRIDDPRLIWRFGNVLKLKNNVRYVLRSGRENFLIMSFYFLLELIKYKPDVVLVGNPAALLVTCISRFVFNFKVHFDLMEEYHDDMLDRFVNGRYKRLLGKAIHFVIEGCLSRVHLLSYPGLIRRESYNFKGLELEFTHLVSEHYYSACESQFDVENKIVFNGKFANGNGTIQLIKAIYVLRSKGVKIKALVISFDEKLELHFRQKYSECYILLPQVSHDRIWDYYKKCHFGFIGYGDVFGHKSIPNRFIEYTCALIPVIYHNTSVQMNYWNQSMDVGVAINVEDVNSIVDILELFCEDQDFWFKKVDNCRKHRNEFSLEKGSRNLQLMYESL